MDKRFEEAKEKRDLLEGLAYQRFKLDEEMTILCKWIAKYEESEEEE